MNAEQLANRIAQLALEKKAENIIIQDLRGLTTMTDFFVLCSIQVEPQAKAVISHVKNQLREEGIKPWHTEGGSDNTWILMDFVDVVLHVFQREARDFYSLERLWSDAKTITIKENDETAGTHPE